MPGLGVVGFVWVFLGNGIVDAFLLVWAGLILFGLGWFAFLFWTTGLFLLSGLFLLESLILAQDERWRRASHMQVEREPLGSSGERVSIT